MADLIFPGKAQNRAGNILAFVGKDHGAQFLRQGQHSRQQPLCPAVDYDSVFGRSLYVNCIPVPVELSGQSRGIPKQHFTIRTLGTETDHYLIRHNGTIFRQRFVSSQIYLSRHFPERQFPQIFQIGGFEKVIKGGRYPFRRINLALPQAFLQVLGREVYIDDLIRLGQDTIGQALPDLYPDSFFHHVVETLQVLDIHGCNNMDTSRQQVLNVFITLRIFAARHIGMGQFIDHGHLRLTA